MKYPNQDKQYMLNAHNAPFEVDKDTRQLRRKAARSRGKRRVETHYNGQRTVWRRRNFMALPPGLEWNGVGGYRKQAAPPTS